jgi:uncharacterized protein
LRQLRVLPSSRPGAGGGEALTMTGSLWTHWEGRELTYTGVELRPHFLLERLGQRGSGIGAFVGPCRVSTEHLVDWEDRLAGDRIEAARMVHFLGEFFGVGLREGVLFQRVFTALAAETLLERLTAAGRAEEIRRSGDDLFVRDRKLSVSIVTASPVSVLFHCGINVDPSGAPVPAIGLAELGVAVDEWVSLQLERVSAEWESIDWACAKVRPVV